ncbi:type VI lipase adapter Tla3 domain-containing protein [Dyella terrae]|uniref:type VI lipase adapter Tla3 domain-containing protein n=1 Tax=Dyella terrae TaxID=522259 RepID=UPI001EFE108F|nr:DUF2875 family protein [Dyella terrae]ULU23589.1 hypothetical protein DYST_00487 [Dyella terrae]
MLDSLQHKAPTGTSRLETLDVLSVGLSVDVFRQGQAWGALQQQAAAQPNSLHVGSALPMDPKKYPSNADDKDVAYEKRELDALELGLRDFPEKWSIPTVTVVRGWSSDIPNPRVPIDMTQNMLGTLVDRLRPDAGLHWHRIRNLPNGIACDDDPEFVIESIFQLFERSPDLPAVLIYVDEGFNMQAALSSKNVSLQSIKGGLDGPREPGELTDSMVALVVGRRERINWLRFFAPYTKVNKNPVDPEFTGWARPAKQTFVPTPYIPQPFTKRALEQWDALKTLAVLHRPVTVSLDNPAKPGTRLKSEALATALADGWKKAIDGVTPSPARVFYDGGPKPVTPPLAELTPALKVAGSSVDLLDSKESYDLTQRLGDTGAASPFVGIALATMATYLNADTSIVIPLRRNDEATLITITSATPGKKPAGDPFGVNLLPQTASSEKPSARIRAELADQWRQEEARRNPTIRPIDQEQIARDKQALDDFIAGGPGVDLDKP